MRATDDLPSADPLAELFWLHRLFGDWDGDDPTCGCGAVPPEDACEEPFGSDRWHDGHLAATVRSMFPDPTPAAPSEGAAGTEVGE